MSLSTTSTDASPSSLFSSISTTSSLTTQTTIAQTTTAPPVSTGFGGGSGNGNGNGGNYSPPNNSGGTLATSAALYLYTFLATLVLLLAVSAAIVIRSFILRRRHRRMVEEAIRNGTWVPPSPPSQPVRVDLSKKPVLWEAYLDNKGSISYLHDGGKSFNLECITEHTKDWDMIRPISAAYLESSIPPTSNTTADPTPPNHIPESTPVDEPPSHATPPSTRIPIHRAIFSRAMQMLNPTPVATSPLPAANLSNAYVTNGNGTGTGDAHITMTELDEKAQSPSLLRVAVLIAMPKPPSSSSSTRPSTAARLSVSASIVDSSPATQSHPLQINPAFPLPLSPAQDEPQLPHIEVGVAEVLVVPPDLVTQEDRERQKLRGSVWSRDSVATEVG